MLLEAQLEKQSDNQGTSEEMEQVHEKKINLQITAASLKQQFLLNFYV